MTKCSCSFWILELRFIFKRISSLSIITLLLFLPGTTLAALDIDGRLDEPDWAEAQVFRDFVVIDPLTFESPRLPTEARLLSTPEGLAVAFICEQPSNERTRTVTQRDALRFDSDSVSVMIDFDGTSQIAYEFSVSITGSYRDGTITNESDFNYDWDGLWQRAVNEEQERWTVEILLPWSIVAMRESQGETRRLGLSFQRVLQANKETFAFPAASTERPQFVSNFAKIEVSQYSEQEFDLWPYATVLSDLKKDSVKGKAGLDVFWKPSGKFQLAATLNPDFGQVESDDLVIDFSAIEVRFSDKRPFFTENQALFELRMPNRGYLIYTRRIGGPSDKDGRPSDIDGALKVIGSSGSFDYGVLAAQEADSEGRSFFGGRLFYPAENWSLGFYTTYVDRPFLDRNAIVNSIDYEVESNDLWRLQGQFLMSRIDTAPWNSSDYGAWYRFHYTPSDAWRFQLDMAHWGNELDISDMGYIMRTDLEEIFLYNEYRQTDFREDSRSASVAWVFWILGRRNTDGKALQSRFVFERQEKLRSGADMNLMLMLNTEGYDDLISRGNGLVRFDERLSGTISYTTPRRGAWRKSLSLNVLQEGYDGWGESLSAGATWYPHEKVNVDFSLRPHWSDDWLIWLREDLHASFSLKELTGEISPSWFPAERHEIRLKTQWIVMHADAQQGYRIGQRGWLLPSSDTVNDFAMLNFGLQLRYRYEIAPLSDFYIVYSRGGLERIDNPTQSTFDMLGRSTRLREADQFLVKLRYRF